MTSADSLGHCLGREIDESQTASRSVWLGRFWRHQYSAVRANLVRCLIWARFGLPVYS